MAKLDFHFSPGACSLATHIALEEAGATFTPKPTYTRKGQTRTPEYLALNPKGKVPLLIVDGKPLTENTAILTFLSRSYPNAKLLPAGDALKEAEALSFIAWCASGVHPVMSRFFGPQNFCDLPDSADNVKALAAKATAANFALIEKALEGKDWVFGEWSVADAYIFVFYNWATKLGLDVSQYPNYGKHFERMKQRPAVQRALAREAEALAAMDKAA
ncbi:MAG TPA: glutathione S-transferase N-terminal domain-containing protein [Ferrovibrio sp.]|uniref:glutathione S-transferase family protein n=1 Tax=Ferrovibrio sp. TaxID=1917215 RepID=UPI002B4AF1EB|nr:glutathione S-transferase N-terminal domain-containing protein [Ferrovibrio sp.]HLT76605.1 glutathione S-transferase N-terminal domain-containing protein [Ferrovibrio sp.]